MITLDGRAVKGAHLLGGENFQGARKGRKRDASASRRPRRKDEEREMSPHCVRPSPGLRPPSPTSWEKAVPPYVIHSSYGMSGFPSLFAARPSPTKWERVAEGRVRAEHSEGSASLLLFWSKATHG